MTVATSHSICPQISTHKPILLCEPSLQCPHASHPTTRCPHQRDSPHGCPFPPPWPLLSILLLQSALPTSLLLTILHPPPHCLVSQISLHLLSVFPDSSPTPFSLAFNFLSEETICNSSQTAILFCTFWLFSVRPFCLIQAHFCTSSPLRCHL